MPLTPHQQAVFDQIEAFLSSEGPGVFILKGYAGTGKTFMMKQLASWLAEKETQFTLLASTGRAATVLRAKTTFEALTIHSALYTFHRVDGDYEHLTAEAAMDEFGQMKLLFRLRAPDTEGDKVYIVDEASMISDLPGDETSYASFGSGRLLTDLMSITAGNKIIFTGDPCQLPPVLGTESPALSEAWFGQKGFRVQSAELTEIIRHKEESSILRLAFRVREMARQGLAEKFPKLPVRDIPDIHLIPEHKLLDLYKEFTDRNGYYKAIAVSHSNKNCYSINRVIRHHRFSDPDMILMPGDILIVTQNNYLVPLTNGDFIEVIAVGEKHIHCQISFSDIRVKAIHNGLEYHLLLCDETLNTGIANLTLEQQRNLMVDFSIRMRKKKIKPNSDQYALALRQDPHLNSLRTGYGYAVTCHKSQGGEWDHVFLFLNKYMYLMEKETLLRWWYTGITRAKEELYLTDDLSWII